MTSVEKQLELKDKILAGLEIVYERLIEYKKQKNSVLVIMKDDKIVKIKPE
jgi:hypothetical protein